MNKKVKVCFIQVHAYAAFQADSRANIGGAEIQLYFLSTGLARDPEFEIGFIVGDWGQNNIEHHDSVTIYKSFSLLKKSFGTYIKAPFLLWKALLTANADVYVCTAAGPEHAVVSLFCWIHKRKMIYRVASQSDVDKTFKVQSFWQTFFFRYALKRADAVVCQTEEQRKNLRQYFGREGCLIRSIFIGPTNLSAIPHQRKKVLWVGHAVGLKQPWLFLDLAYYFPCEKFIIVMTPEDQCLWSETKKQAHTIKNVKFIGRIPYERTWEFFQEAKVLINTSTREGFPYTFLQALALGVPVISLTANPDGFLDTFKCGFSVHGDINIMKENLSRLLSNRDLYRELADNGRKYVRKYHDQNIILNSWKNLILKTVF